MSERLFKFLLSELETVRITCVKEQCGFTIESSVANLPKVAELICPFCKTAFDPDRVLSGLMAVPQLAKLSHRLKIEFVLPDPSAD